MDKELSIEKETTRAIVDLTRHKEFYGHIVQQFQKIFVSEKHEVKTAAIGRVRGERFLKLYVNLDFAKNLYYPNGKLDKLDGMKKLIGVIEHEILHCCFNHLFLALQDKTRQGIAVDLVVNSYIEKDRLPEGCVFPDQYGFETGKSAMWYYVNLKENKEYQRQLSSGELTSGKKADAQASHSVWEDIKDDPLAQEFAKDIIRKAVDLCDKKYGSVHADVISQIGELMAKKKSIIPWGKVLRLFVASCSENFIEYTMKRISKRFGTRPGTRSGEELEIAVAVDTSGSIDSNQLNMFFNEIKWIWKNGAKITIYEADCQICETYKFNGKFNGKVHGGGGTDLEPVLVEVEKRGYDALIYFTDFYAPSIEKRYNIPTLWVLSTGLDKESYPVKWGKHITINDGVAKPV